MGNQIRKVRKGLYRSSRYLRTIWAYGIPVADKPVHGLKYFCQNAGSCGSNYIVELMKVNGYRKCYHELPPSLDTLGVRHFEGSVDRHRLRSLLSFSRRDIFFEANNRLFSMTGELQAVFPDARFIHLHRDAREVIPSALSKPPSLTWESGRLRYESEKLCGPRSAPVLERACHYWTNYNERILNDLLEIPHLSLKFNDLVGARLEGLEAFMNADFSVKKIEPVNSNKPVRDGGVHPEFEDWSARDRSILLKICGPTLEKLGYLVN